MGFLYPGLGVELRYRIDSFDRKVVYLNQDKFDPLAWKFYPIGASPELSHSTSRILQMREVAMMIFMEKITDKERWYEKVYDQDIVAKWKQETMEMSERGLYERIMWEKNTDKIPFPEQGRIMSQAAVDFVSKRKRGPRNLAKMTVHCRAARQGRILPKDEPHSCARQFRKRRHQIRHLDFKDST